MLKLNNFTVKPIPHTPFHSNSSLCNLPQLSTSITTSSTRSIGHDATLTLRNRHLCIVAASPPSPPPSPIPRKRIAVFVSGGGSNFKKIHAKIESGDIHGDIVLVVSDKAACGGISYAHDKQIATVQYPPSKKSDTGLSEADLLDALLTKHQVDLVVLAGYLKLVPTSIVRAYRRRMLNIHPALLPSFGGKGLYGHFVHEAVVKAGVRFSGPTVHFVDEEYDTGPILAQAVVPIHPVMTPDEVARRVLAAEHEVYPRAVSAFCADRITWREDGVPILWEAH